MLALRWSVRLGRSRTEPELCLVVLVMSLCVLQFPSSCQADVVRRQGGRPVAEGWMFWQKHPGTSQLCSGSCFTPVTELLGHKGGGGAGDLHTRQLQGGTMLVLHPLSCPDVISAIITLRLDFVIKPSVGWWGLSCGRERHLLSLGTGRPWGGRQRSEPGRVSAVWD